MNLISGENKTVLSIKNLYKSFGENKVLIDFNLELNEMENIVVLGKSGSGKSVLIKCIIGLLTPDQGEIIVFDKSLSKINSNQLDEVRSKIGFLFQSNALYDSMTVKENLEFPLRRHKIKYTQEKVDELILNALDDVHLSQTLNMMPAELSGGMRKRIALARTLILKPEIILYDEPTTGLDPITGKEIIQLMIDIKNKYKTSALIISHDINCVKLASDRVVILLEGKCYITDTYESIKYSKDPKVKQFFE
jgi:phospholipid/cholesterol/gamma-HCH transport system ATP-binding protein